MPTYQYACTDADCGNRFELVQSFTDPAASSCPVCGGAVRKVFSSVGVVFKGSGFYRTDSRAEAKSSTAAKSESSKSTDSSGSSSTAASTGSSTGSSTSSNPGSEGSSGSGSSGSSAAKGSGSTGSSKVAAASA
jgi:putative FmdB family regulatory protein